MTDVTKNIRDAAYVLIGLGVVGFQQAQEQADALRARLEARRVEARKQLDKQLEETRAQVSDRVSILRARLNRAA